MARVRQDHYVPRAYLRGFTPEYLQGEKGGMVTVILAGHRRHRRASINDAVGCEPNFYAGHPIDQKWADKVERPWPDIRDQLKERDLREETLDGLLWFVAAQFMRTPRFMNDVAERLAYSHASIHEVEFEGRKIRGKFMGQANTGEVMDVIAAHWPEARKVLGEDYHWTLHHIRHGPRYFLTSDNPCVWEANTEVLTFPLALDMALLGRVTGSGELPTFRHTNAKPDVVGRINRSTVAGCDSFLYMHDVNDGVLDFVEKNRVERDLIRMGRGFSPTAEPVTEEEFIRAIRNVERLRQRDRESKAADGANGAVG